MDWYTRCIVGVRLTPVSTKSIDAAAVLYQAYRPRRRRAPAGATRSGPSTAFPGRARGRRRLPTARRPGMVGPAIVPETVVVDHGKIYVSEHLTSVCARLGISIQPARPYARPDKAPVERFFRTLREGLLQALPGTKVRICHRGRVAEDQASYFLDELEAIIREWVAGADTVLTCSRRWAVPRFFGVRVDDQTGATGVCVQKIE